MRVPRVTYRLQLHRGCDFDSAARLVPYLAQLGVSDLYLSPILRAVAGSTHGYDIVDHGALNPELGGEPAFGRLAATLRAHGLGLVLDVVPNHMGVDPDANPWWRDVLENGQASPFAGFFDIDWHPVKPELRGKVLLPILGEPYGTVLERGGLALALADGTIVVRYADHTLPLDPREVPHVLEHDLDTLRTALGGGHPDVVEYQSIATALRNLPARDGAGDEARVAERQRERAVARQRLGRLLAASAPVRGHLEGVLATYNGTPGDSASHDRLHALLDAQAYRLAYWRTASHDINYRRFFDVDRLAGLRMEDPRVFEATHQLLLRLVSRGPVTGIRVDHIDGLFDPAGYLGRLRALLGTDATWVVVEKILAAEESLPASWAAQGSSGYDFLNEVTGVFVDRRNRRAMLRIYHAFAGLDDDFTDVVYASKRFIMDTALASELNVLAHAASRLAECDRHTRDFTLSMLRHGLREVVAAFPVYRTYVTAEGTSAADRSAIATAIATARGRNPTTEPSLWDFLGTLLLPDATRPEHLQFAMRFQQYTAPVHAKAIEDTSFHRWVPLVALNEVGGDPVRFGVPIAQFHAANLCRQRQWPSTLLTTATHDTKRGEDARARLAILSEMPGTWDSELRAWATVNLANRSVAEGRAAPDRNDEYLFYQTLLAVWPPGAIAADGEVRERVRTYLRKAAREAKVHTSWVIHNQPYEYALDRFVETTLDGDTTPRFLARFVPFASRIARLGMLVSLAQLVLKMTSPGVADLYQGSEGWDLSLVDPDNRRPVDFASRARWLEELRPLVDPPEDSDGARVRALGSLLATWEDGRVKLAVTAIACALRRRLEPLFVRGVYQPLLARGARASHVVAFARRYAGRVVVVVVPRLITRLTSDTRPLPLGPAAWPDTTLEIPRALVGAAPFRDVFTGRPRSAQVRHASATLALADVLADFPVAVFEATERAEVGHASSVRRSPHTGR